MSMENNTHSILLSGFQPPFLEFARQLFSFDIDLFNEKYDILVMGESGGDIKKDIECRYVICPQSMKLDGIIKCRNVITCGMNTRCTLSFSSIDFNKALLSVNRRIDLEQKSIHQCERPVDYYEPLTVYENLVLQGLTILTI